MTLFPRIPQPGDLLLAKACDGRRVVLYDTEFPQNGSINICSVEPGQIALILYAGDGSTKNFWTLMVDNRVWLYNPVAGWSGVERDWDLV